jgi:peptidoglycan/xylan/chitin deacetylase (PgdA/CDA1 family)
VFFKKVKYRLLLWTLELLFACGFEKLLFRFHEGYRILIFHGIDFDGNTHFNSRFVSVQFLDELLALLSRHCVFISMEDVYKKNFSPGKFHVALTFDDGLQNNYDLALPILQKYNVPATFFVCPSNSSEDFLWPDFLDLVTSVSKKPELHFEGVRYVKEKEYRHGTKTLKNRCKELDWKSIQNLFPIFEHEWNEIKQQDLEVYWKLMKPVQLKEIANDPLFTIGAHTIRHLDLTAISLEEARLEMLESKQQLEEIAGIPINSFAFTFGSYNSKLVTLAEKIGFEQILLMQKQGSESVSNSCLERFGINPHISAKAQVFFLLKGRYL